MTRGSVIDLVFISAGLKNQYIDWEINQNLASGSDHEILLFSILGDSSLVENPVHFMPYNLKKADWKIFSQKLLELDKDPQFQWKYQEKELDENSSGQDLDQDSDLGLETKALNLQQIIYLAAESSILKRKPSQRSKVWWSDKLKGLRKEFNMARKKWKIDPSYNNYKAFKISRNLYFSEIKIAKTNCWNLFLENAQGKEIFKAFGYTKNRLTTRLPILKYNLLNPNPKSSLSHIQTLNPKLSAITF